MFAEATVGEVPDVALVDLKLLKDEVNSCGFMIEKGISSITIYKGDFKTAAAAIRAVCSCGCSQSLATWTYCNCG